MKRVSLSSGKLRSASRLFALLVAMCWATQGFCRHGHDAYGWWDDSYYNIEVDGIYYRFGAYGEVGVCRGLGDYSGVVNIPKEIVIEHDGGIRSYEYYSVTEIYSAFKDCSNVTEVHIPNSVSNIYGDAFSGCTNLEKIVVAEDNPYYDSREGCNAIIRTENNELIAGCKNTFIPNSVTSIGYYAFSNCTGLTEVTIPGSVTSIIPSAFRGCINLEKIVVESSNAYYDSRENCNAIIRTDQNELIYGCKNTHIPNGVTAISSSAFYGCTGLTGELVIPNSVTNIGASAFYGCTGLTGKLVIPNSVTFIGEGSFEGCTGLTGELNLPNSVNDIGASAFEECSGLTGLTIGKGVVSIGKHAFLGCSSLEKIVVDADNRYYDSREDCNAIIRTYGTEQTLIAGCKNSHIPNGVTAIDEHAFYGMAGLTKIHIPNSVTSIDKYAFEDCDNLAELSIGSGVTSISQGAFYNCAGLTKVHIPNSVTSIEDWAFNNCSDMTEVIIGNNVTSIGSGTFSRCESLASITSLNPVPPTIDYDTFEWVTKETATLHVPEGCKRTYWTLPYWEEFVNIQDDATDGIKSVFTDKQGRTAIYTLDGKRLSTTNAADLSKGIYVVNGKKVVVK